MIANTNRLRAVFIDVTILFQLFQVCISIEECLEQPYKVSRFLESVRYLKSSLHQSSKLANKSTGDLSNVECANRFVATYLKNINVNVNQELGVANYKRSFKCLSHPLLDIIQDHSHGSPQVKLVQEQPSAAMVFTRKTRLDELKLGTELNEEFITDNLKYFLQQSDAYINRKFESDDSLNDLIKRIYYKEVICDICLSRRNLLYEQLTNGLNELLSNGPIVLPLHNLISKLDVYNGNLPEESLALIKGAVSETFLCKYARSATVTAFLKEDNLFSLRLHSLESL